MKLKTKIWTLITLFCVRAILYLGSGVFGLIEGISYGEYSGDLINAAIMGYVAYLLYTTKNKWTYWLAVFFSGLIVMRFIMAMSLFVYAEMFPSEKLMTLVILNGVIFGVVPLIFLFNKELRAAYLSPKI